MALNKKVVVRQAQELLEAAVKAQEMSPQLAELLQADVGLALVPPDFRNPVACLSYRGGFFWRDNGPEAPAKWAEWVDRPGERMLYPVPEGA